ncbi:hypothetical protein AAMO2058_000436200 [Amorphochlora amoebiformis]
MATDMDKLKELSAKKYADQAVAFMNVYWDKFYKNEKAREELWTWTNIFIKLDKKKEKGCELNEFDAHRFLEQIDETLSVKDMREFLRSVDIDFNKMVSLTEYLVSKFKVDWKVYINTPIGMDEKRQKELQDARNAVIQAKEKAENAMAEKKNSDKAAAEAKAAAEEVKAALAKVLSEEKKYQSKLAKHEKDSKDTSLGVVKRNKAANLLQQLKAKPTLSLQQAKITLQAAERKSTKAAKKAANAAIIAGEALKRAEQAFAEAEEKLKEILDKPVAGGNGSSWWLNREFEEAKKYMPKSKLAKMMKKRVKAEEKA